MTRHTLAVISAFALCGLVAANASAAAAIDPGLASVGSGPGWMYTYGESGSDRATWRTTYDGTITEQVVGAPVDYGCDLPECVQNSGAIGVPSYGTLDGDRWYVAHRFTSTDIVFPTVSGPYGQVAIEIDVVREGDTTGLTVTDNRSECMYVGGSFPSWAPDSSGLQDRAVTWVGAQWADLDGDPIGDCETFVQAGIFRAELTFDASGAVIGATPPVLAVPVPINADYNLSNITGFDWSPDASAAAYVWNPMTWGVDGALYVATTGSPTETHDPIAVGNFGHVDWSPDRDSIAGLQTSLVFSGRMGRWGRDIGTFSVAPDGSGLLQLAAGRQAKNSKQSSLYHGAPYWSPDGSMIAYLEIEDGSALGDLQRRVRRMNSDGTGNILILEDSATRDLRVSLGWLSEDGGSPPPPPPPPAGESHVADLDGAGSNQGGRWRATVAVVVHDDAHAPVAGATVSGSWIAGASGSATCTTDAAGTCTVTSGKVSRSSVDSVEFRLDGISHASLTYAAGSNHDPDGDSDGTSISVGRP